MSVELWNYEAALLEMERFREHNSLVLDTWELMQGRLREVEEALKDFARQNGPEEDERFAVDVTRYLVGLRVHTSVSIRRKSRVAEPVTEKEVPMHRA